MLRYVFDVVFDGRLEIATFLDRESAREFCENFNDSVGADVMDFEPRALVDNYGFPY